MASHDSSEEGEKVLKVLSKHTSSFPLSLHGFLDEDPRKEPSEGNGDAI